jgi:spore germination protein YaaH/flagellar hook assembly protein FlgD
VSGSRVAPRRTTPLAVAVLVASLLAGGLPAPQASAAGPAPGGPDRDPVAAAPGEQPSIAYLEAMAHEDDRIAFEPGARVAVPFTPRADDRWPIDGRVPRGLPAGRASGHQIAATPNGAAWADLGPGAKRPDQTGADATGLDPATAASDGDGPADAPDAPVDEPAGDPVIPVAGAAWSPPAADPVSDLAAASGLRRQVFGFLPYWEVSGAADTLNYDVLSTIAYFSVGASRNGDLKKRDRDGRLTTGWAGWTSAGLTRVIDRAHARGTRVVLTVSVFAWTSAQADIQRAILGSRSARENLARQAAAAVRDRGADGINLDFEPLASGYAEEFVAFLKAVRAELNRVGSGYQLTYDTTGHIGNYPLEASVGPGVADAIFVMGYDYRGGSASTAGSIDPLSGPRYDLTDTVRAYTARVKPSRIILGLPWYGRAWSTVDDSVRSATRDGAKFGYSTAVNYGNVVALVERHGRRWDGVERTPYVAYRRENCTTTYGCVTSWRQVYYEDGASLRLRLEMVNEYGLRGAGMWALGYDGGHAELYRAYAESFLVDKSAPQAGIRMLAATQGDEGFVVGWSARDTSRVASYDVQVSVAGGAWTTWLAGTTATSDVWLGRDGTGYAFRVRARDSKGNLGAWNVASRWQASPELARGGFGRVTSDGLAYRAGPGTDAMRLGRLDAGTIVAVTGGPVSEDGWTWYEVTQPVREWGPVSFVERGVWIAAHSSSVTHVVPSRAPNSTRVSAGLVGLEVGDAAGRAFSPNGDGSRDTLRLRWTNAQPLDALELRVLRTGGALVGTVAVPELGAGDRAWAWNGRVGGSRVADGRYVLQLVATAGGRTYTAPSARPTTATQVARHAVTVDTVRPSLVSATASARLISPNGDGTLDRTRLAVETSGSSRWTIRIANGGAVVREAGGGAGSGALAWTGTDDAGNRVPDGRYLATLAGWDAAGNAASRSIAITVDTRGPVAHPSADPGLFSPNGDGAADTTRLAWTADERASGWVRVYRGDTRIRGWAVDGATSWAATWNGRRADGSPVPDGRYTLRTRLVDAAGNARTASAPVVVDRTAGGLAWSGDFHPQDGDALRPRATLRWRLTRDATTTLRILDASGAVVRSAWSGRDQRAGNWSWSWDGTAGSTTVPQGTYTARLTVVSPLGTSVLERSVLAAAFRVRPSASSVAPGDGLRIRIETVEPLATRPVVTFRQPGLRAVRVTATRLADGTYRAVFRVASGGDPGTGSIRVSATDTDGGTNATSVPIRVRR